MKHAERIMVGLVKSFSSSGGEGARRADEEAINLACVLRIFSQGGEGGTQVSEFNWIS